MTKKEAEKVVAEPHVLVKVRHERQYSSFVSPVSLTFSHLLRWSTLRWAALFALLFGYIYLNALNAFLVHRRCSLERQLKTHGQERQRVLKQVNKLVSAERAQIIAQKMGFRKATLQDSDFVIVRMLPPKQKPMRLGLARSSLAERTALILNP